ncbi:hypothetical protein [Streptomyces sp. NPDC002082]|uniref:hypothetical protein n=1 Tax=Streptomyces sp. NPDC002082 TaxID=3154772 RepID=UPI0033286DF7
MSQTPDPGTPPLPPVPSGACPYSAAIVGTPVPRTAVAPVLTVAGNGVATWHLTRPADVRAVLGDAASFTSRRGPEDPPPGPAGREILPTRPGMFVQTDGRDHHLDYRRLLNHEFSALRTTASAARITAHAETHVQSMVSAGATADLVAQYALPLVSQTLCEVLGLPWTPGSARRMLQVFQGRDLGNADLNSTTTPVDHLVRDLARDALAAPHRYPGLVGRIAAEGIDGRALTEDEFAGLAKQLLMPGHVSPTHMLGLSVLVLLEEQPAWYAKLAADPGSATDVVEELLHHITVKQHGLIRRAVRDTAVGGVLIRAGQWVTCHLDGADTGPAAFAPGRTPVTHLAFGDGPHQCLGQHLSRVVLVGGLRVLARRLPALRLAVAPHQLHRRVAHTVAGVTSLPVTW